MNWDFALVLFILLLLTGVISALEWGWLRKRRLRSADLEALTPDWRRLILGYDLAVVAPELSASSVLGTNEAP